MSELVRHFDAAAQETVFHPAAGWRMTSDLFVFAPAVVALIVMAALLHEFRRPRPRTLPRSDRLHSYGPGSRRNKRSSGKLGVHST
jgi:hypothetical protein